MSKIITYPNPVLDTPAQTVTFPLNDATKELIANMWETVAGIGVGLAAPQVGVSKRICIIHMSESKIATESKTQDDFVMINPTITFRSQVESLMIEGCLSFPGQYYEIWRPSNIIVEYYDEKGKKHLLKAKEWLARIIQHEVDHLDGKIFTTMGGKKIEPEELENEDNDKVVVD